MSTEPLAQPPPDPANTLATKPSRVIHLMRLAPSAGFWRTGIKMGELTLAHGATYAFPLIFAVVCARNLGAANYGVVSFYTALTAILCMLIEFGFDAVGVREVNDLQHRREPGRVLWNVTWAKLVICAATSLFALPVLLATRSADEASMAFALLFYLVGFALDTSWYMRSRELMRSVLLVAGVSRLAGIVLLLAVVQGEGDRGAAMWTYAFVAWAHALVGLYLLRWLGLLSAPRADLHHLRTLFRSGGSIVVGNLSGAGLTSGGIAILGVMADPVLTGAANIALRIKMAGQAVLLPAVQLGFVRLSRLAGEDRARAVALGRRLFYGQMALSLAVSVVIIANADALAGLAYGNSRAPEAAGLLVGMLAVGLPASIAGNLFGLQFLTLLKHERAYVLILSQALVLFLGLLWVFDASHSVNYGWCLVAAEAWVVVAAGAYLRQIIQSDGL